MKTNRMMITVLSLISIVAMLLCSCAKAQEVKADSEENDVTVNQTSTVRDFKDMGMSLATTTWGLLQQSTLVNDRFAIVEPVPTGGCYIREYRLPEMNEVNIGDNDNPVIDDIRGGAAPLSANGNLIIIKNGQTPIPSSDWEGTPSIIYMEESEGKFKPLITLKNNELFSMGMEACDTQDNLYSIVQVFDTETYSSLKESYLMRINIHSGETTVLKNWEGFAIINIIGIYPEGLVIQKMDYGSSLTGGPAEMSLELYSVLSNTGEDIDLSWKEGEYSTALDDQGHVYYCNGKALNMYDLASGEKVAVDQDISLGEEIDSILLLGEVIDTHIPYYIVTTSGNEILCSYDLTTGECSQNQKTYIFDGEDVRPMTIWGTYEDKYVVLSGARFIPETYSDKDGSYSIDRGYDTYSLISQNEYWNS